MLAKDLPQIAEAGFEPEVRAVARTVHENYIYPVDSQVLSTSGELIDQVGANSGPGVAGYRKLLDAAAPAEPTQGEE